MSTCLLLPSYEPGSRLRLRINISRDSLPLSPEDEDEQENVQDDSENVVNELPPSEADATGH